MTGGNVGSIFDMGITIVSADALAAAAVPDPDDASEDGAYMFRTRQVVYTSVTNDSSQRTRLKEDIRAMRKIPGEDWQCVAIMTAVAGGATNVNVDGIIRQLLLRA